MVTKRELLSKRIEEFILYVKSVTPKEREKELTDFLSAHYSGGDKTIALTEALVRSGLSSDAIADLTAKQLGVVCNSEEWKRIHAYFAAFFAILNA